MGKDQSDRVEAHFRAGSAVYNAMAADAVFRDSVVRVADEINRVFARGNRLFIAGNGGSAADAQHFAAELVGWYKKDQKPRSAIALTTDTSFLTAWSNDADYESVFSRQLEAHASGGDMFFGISTSGASKNILHALDTARRKELVSVALLNEEGGEARQKADIALLVPARTTPHVQELHIAVIHAICECIERS